MRRLVLASLALALCVTSGCSGPDMSTFHGTVAYRGRPLTSGVIYFLGPAPAMQMGMGTIHDDGTYTATDVPVGEVRVAFQAPGVPDQFTDPNTSGLVYKVTSRTKSLDIIIPEGPADGSGAR